MKRWSKLQSQIEALFDRQLRLRIHCAGFRDNYGGGGGPAELGRYWFMLDGDILWDFPRQFVSSHSCYMPLNESTLNSSYPYSAADVSAVLREYLNTPVDSLLSTEFKHDRCGACELLRAADRRLSVRRLMTYYSDREHMAVMVILAARGADRLIRRVTVASGANQSEGISRML